MGSNHRKLVADAQGKVFQGVSADEVIKYLHHQGISIIDAIKVIREVYGISLGESKRLVTSNSAWGEVVEAARSLHDDLENYVLNEQRDSEGSADN
jgi:ribosomal protein L7/L12